MKAFNVLLSILVLLLAIASAVFSYFLFEKRQQMILGWEKMAKAINQSATSLDSGSGTEIARQVSAENLSHKKYSELDNHLPKLNELSQQIIRQRDDFSKTLRKIAHVIELENTADIQEFQKLATYSPNKTRVVEGIEHMKERRDRTLRMICATAKKVGASVSVNDLQSDNYAGEFRKLDDKISAIQSKFSAYNSNFKKIASLVGAPSPTFSDSEYKSSIAKIASSVSSMKSEYDSAKKQLETTNSRIAKLKNTITEKDGQISSLNKSLTVKEKEIDRLAGIIHGSKGGAKKLAGLKLWQTGSPESRRAVQGKVIEVNDRYGFIVVDLGRKTRVKQHIGKKVNNVDPVIQNNAAMIVARSLDSGDGEFVGKIKLFKVHNDCSIAKVIPGSTGDRRVKVGDTVYFSNEQIAQMMSSK
ncbi:hypothetical protein P0136_11590 [Lentisphaerota bacterium ZTH]|nr:hypothetical protein JYG24_10890 [Lentisphaerota bacterium]WET06000.1 hypothetical protein P0136_11590 [Lentisphaerota bacterium ZTH]